VKLIGDITNREILESQCRAAGKPGLLEFSGYTSDVVSVLSKINVMPYLLNPEHYGTTENALIEAMAMGIVPVVLDNPAEQNIVADGETGLVVESVEEFAAAMRWLFDNPGEREKLGRNAARSVRERFTVERMEATLNSHYAEILSEPKTLVDFISIFGSRPSDWLLSCQKYPEVFKEPLAESYFDENPYMKHGLYERTKGTAYHFLKYFQDDPKLAEWSNWLDTKR
jgi:hypothetical protein